MITRKTLHRALGLGGHYTGLIVFALFTTFPFLWALSSGLSADASRMYQFPAGFWPQDMSLVWFERVFQEMPFTTYLKNSALLSLFTILGVVAVSVLAGYPLARMKFPGRGLIFVAIIATMMLPSEVGIVPNFITLKHFGDAADALQGALGLGPDWSLRGWVGLDSYFGAMAPNFAGAFGIFLMKQAFEAIPQDLIDAARVDGASEMQILWKVMVPVTTPSLAALAIFTLVGAWNDYLWPSIVLTSKDKLPLAVGVFNDLTGPFATSDNILMAAIVLTIVPVLVFFACTQRYFISGLDGAVK
ncbi:carbohydrate ABC transporter permease [Chitinilyticum litopenaei]|uniref:carbohydrate ABC transporter permease n=1 Tax=Chitinilyticum litopenaei TaxID=1121276 RepID=UPI0003FA08C4|nr:carbohydrate ABC transporter permease [Chitinilyticum litopenaei]